MPLINYTGAAGAPKLTGHAAQLATITGLRAIFRVPGPETFLDAAGRVASVQDYLNGGTPRAFGTSGDGMDIVQREGVNGMLLANKQLSGPVADFGNNSVLTLFALFHIPEGEGNGVLLGDPSGTRMGIELGGLTSSGLPRIRARSTTTVEFAVAPGWHWMVYEKIADGTSRAQVDGGLVQAATAAVDGNLFQVGLTAAPSTCTVAAFGYALSAMITTGQSRIIDRWARYILGARQVGV